MRVQVSPRLRTRRAARGTLSTAQRTAHDYTASEAKYLEGLSRLHFALQQLSALALRSKVLRSKALRTAHDYTASGKARPGLVEVAFTFSFSAFFQV
jgi:hypothetical protein